MSETRAAEFNKASTQNIALIYPLRDEIINEGTAKVSPTKFNDQQIVHLTTALTHKKPQEKPPGFP